MKKFFMYAISLALCTTMVSCGDDDDDQGGNPGGAPAHGEAVEAPEISDFGGVRLMNLVSSDNFGNEHVSYSFSYNAQGALSQIASSYDRMQIDYANGKAIFIDSDGDRQECALFTNQKGYATEFVYSGYESPSEPFTVRHIFTYDSNDHLVKYECIDTGKDDGRDYTEKEVSELTWEGDLLVKSHTLEIDNGVVEWENTVNFGYTNAPDNANCQYTSALALRMDVDSDIVQAAFAGAFGKGPSKYPTSVSTEYETTNIVYELNAQGLAEKETIKYVNVGADDYSEVVKYTYSAL